MTGFKESYR